MFFASERAGKRNVYRIPVDGGEAEALTEWKGALSAYHVSPDGKWIAFAATPERPETDLAKKQKRDFRVIDEDPPNRALYLVPVDEDMDGKRPVRRLASGPFSVGAFHWSPDSRRIGFRNTSNARRETTTGAPTFPKWKSRKRYVARDCRNWRYGNRTDLLS